MTGPTDHTSRVNFQPFTRNAATVRAGYWRRHSRSPMSRMSRVLTVNQSWPKNQNEAIYSN